MPSYGVLIRADANRVYGKVAADLTVAELRVLGAHLLPGQVTDVRTEAIGGVDYVVFTSEAALDERATGVVSSLSSAHALFERRDGLLAPMERRVADLYDDDLLTTLRYTGKTNETFTRLLVNLALAANPSAAERARAGEQVRLLDPLAGRGTTLNQALTYGLDAFGIEATRRDHEAYVTFLGAWLKEKRLKHKIEESTIRRGRESAAHRARFHIGSRSDSGRQQLVDVVHDDTRNAREHFGKGSVDVIATDLPYGVQHGARGTGPGAGRSRLSLGLVEEALPLWRELLRGGGSVAAAFNARTLERAALEEAFDDAGFEVDEAAAAESFVHRVDRMITRDVLVATRA